MHKLFYPSKNNKSHYSSLLNSVICYSKIREFIDKDGKIDFSEFEIVIEEKFNKKKMPYINFLHNAVYVNSAALRLFPSYDYIQILIHPVDKLLILKPCIAPLENSFIWRNLKKPNLPSKIYCRIFAGKIFSLMEWDFSMRYACEGCYISHPVQPFILFDLNQYEMIPSTSKNAPRNKNFVEEKKDIYTVYAYKDKVDPSLSR